MRIFRPEGGNGGITPDVIVDDIPGIIISEEVPEEDEDDKEHTKTLKASDEHGVGRSLQEIIEEWNALEELSKEIVQQWVAEIEKLFEYLKNNEMFIAVINDDNFPPNKKLEEYNKEIIKYQFKLSLKRDFQKVELFKKMLQDNGPQLLDVFICRMSSKAQQSASASIYRDDEVQEKLRFVSFLPLYTLRAACGAFGDGDTVESEGWVNAEGSGRLDETMFAVHAKGHSMEPMIYDGDICKMRKVGGGDNENKIVLVQHYNEVDSETGGEYSIKRFTRDGDKVILRSLNPDYEDIVIEDTADYSTAYRLIATFEGVIG
jgi:SOS-response transcriptional repressor LexA